MSAYNKKDMALLQEAYSVRLLKEQISYISLGDLQQRLPLMCESELKFVTEGLENILEFWGGLKNLGKGVMNAGKQVASNVGNAIGSAGKGIAAAGKQVASNVGDIYKSGEKTSALNSASAKAQELVDELVELITKYEPGETKEMIMSSTLQEILEILAQATQQTQQNTPKFTQGVGNAASQAYSANRQHPARSPATPPPLPQTA